MRSLLRRRYRGGAMAFYALFLATAGLPFLSLSIDVSRYWALRARLVNATDAACAAYAQYPDIEWYMEKGKTRFGSEAVGGALMAFHSTMGGRPGDVEIHIGNGQDKDVPVVYCHGTASLAPIIDLGITFTADVRSEAKMAVLSRMFR